MSGTLQVLNRQRTRIFLVSLLYFAALLGIGIHVCGQRVGLHAVAQGQLARGGVAPPAGPRAGGGRLPDPADGPLRAVCVIVGV